MGFRYYGSYWRNKVAVDVGTDCIRVVSGISRLLESPSQATVRSGVVVNSAALAALLQVLLAKTKLFGVVKPHVLACAPSDVNPVERERLVEALTKAGAASVIVVPEPLAAAIGAGVDVSVPYAQMVIDIGEGVTDCAIIRSSHLIETCAFRQGCADMKQYLVTGAGLSTAEAEQMLRSPEADNRRLIFEEFIADSFCFQMVEFLRAVPAHVGAQVIDSGIVLTGGGALLPGVARVIAAKTGIKTTRSVQPLTDVVRGAHAMLPVVTALNQW